MRSNEQKAALKRLKFSLYWLEENIGSSEPLTSKQKREYKRMQRDLLNAKWDFW
jgi:hypothetical protein